MSTLLESPNAEQLEDLPPPFPVKRWTREEYHKLAEQGWFDEQQVELLEGWIVRKMVHRPIRYGMVTLIEGRLKNRLPPTLSVRVQGPVVAEWSEPEPDLAIVRGGPADYLTHHPQGTDILLVVEVAESSLKQDRLKAGIYAQAGIPEYWIIDLQAEMIERHCQPAVIPGRYDSRQLLGRSQTLHVKLGAHNLEISTDELLPPVGLRPVQESPPSPQG